MAGRGIRTHRREFTITNQPVDRSSHLTEPAHLTSIHFAFKRAARRGRGTAFCQSINIVSPSGELASFTNSRHYRIGYNTKFSAERIVDS